MSADVASASPRLGARAHRRRARGGRARGRAAPVPRSRRARAAPLFAYVAAALTGVLTGLVAGKPIWASGAKIEAGLKAFFGALSPRASCSRCASGSHFVPDMAFLAPGESSAPWHAAQVGQYPALALPLVAAVLGGFFELDNTGRRRRGRTEEGRVGVARSASPTSKANGKAKKRVVERRRGRGGGGGAGRVQAREAVRCPPARVVVYLATLGVLVMAVRALLVGPPPLEWAVAATIAYVGARPRRRLRPALARLRRRGGPRPAGRARRGAHVRRRAPPEVDPARARDARQARRDGDVLRRRRARPRSTRASCARSSTPVTPSGSTRTRTTASSRSAGSAASARTSSAASRRSRSSPARRPILFRPPIGHTNPVIARVVDELDLTVVGWTVSGRDGVASARVEDVVARVRRDLRDGAIVLLHDAPEKGDREPAAVKALPAILDAIAAERLDVVPARAPWVRRSRRRQRQHDEARARPS